MGTTKVLFFLSRQYQVETSEHATPRLLSTVLRNTYTRTPPLLRRLPFAYIVFAISRDKRTRPHTAAASSVVSRVPFASRAPQASALPAVPRERATFETELRNIPSERNLQFSIETRRFPLS